MRGGNGGGGGREKTYDGGIYDAGVQDAECAQVILEPMSDLWPVIHIWVVARVRTSTSSQRDERLSRGGSWDQAETHQDGIGPYETR